jgi:hypothetical protein
MGLSLSAPETISAGDPFSLTWDPVPFATGYQLEEATQSDFSGAQVAYDGPNTNTSLAAKDAAGTFYYRVRSQTPYGFGPWFSLGEAAISFSDAEGVIVIEVPIPVDVPDDEVPSTGGTSEADIVVEIDDETAGAEVTINIEGTADANVVIEIDEETADAEITINIEEDSDATIVIVIEEETADAEVTVDIEE